MTTDRMAEPCSPYSVASGAQGQEIAARAGRERSNAVFLIVIACVLYFVPTFTAMMRKSTNVSGVLIVNFITGWTFIGWIIALVMACTGQRKLAPARRPPSPPPGARARPSHGPVPPQAMMPPQPYGQLPPPGWTPVPQQQYPAGRHYQAQPEPYRVPEPPQLPPARGLSGDPS